MARPINADAGATRRRILDAAGILFSEKGEGSTSMRDIARESSVSLATVHHYFGSKAELFRSCVDEMYDELAALRAALLPAVIEAQDFAVAVDHAIRASYRFTVNHARAVRLMLRVVVDTGEVEASRRDAFILPFLDQGAPIVAQAVGLPVAEVRMKLMTLNHIITRFSVTAPAELVVTTQVSPPGAAFTDADVAEAQSRVEDHLVRVALEMLHLAPSSAVSSFTIV